jgi:hypothetical protein
MAVSVRIVDDSVPVWGARSERFPINTQGNTLRCAARIAIFLLLVDATSIAISQ